MILILRSICFLSPQLIEANLAYIFILYLHFHSYFLVVLVGIAWKLARNEFFPFLFWSCVKFAAAEAEKFLQLAILWLISDAIMTFLVSLFVSELLIARTFLAITSKYPEQTFFAVGADLCC